MTSEEFKKWLDDPQYKPLSFNDGSAFRVYMRIPKNEHFDYLYGMSTYHGDSIKRNIQFNYRGIYSKIDGHIYDSDGEFAAFAYKLINSKKPSSMADDVTAAVKAIIEERLEDDCSNLDIRKLTDSDSIKAVERYHEYCLEKEARAFFIAGRDVSSLHFECQYEFGGWNEENLLAYLADKDSFIRAEAKRYWDENQEYMLVQFTEDDLLKGELNRMEAMTDSTLHRIRRIAEAVRDSFAKSVLVTICKEGQEMTFRTDVSELTGDPGSYYSTWHMAAPDRERFKQMFGKGADYTPDEITDIEYRGKSIYSAEPPTMEDGEDESDGMSMTM